MAYNLLKNGFRPALKVFDHLDPDAAEIYGDSDIIVYEKVENGEVKEYAIGSYTGEYIDSCGPNWAYVSDRIREYGKAAENESC